MAVRRLGALCATASLFILSTTAHVAQADQKPIAVPDDPVVVPEDGVTAEDRGQPAKIVLYPGSRTYPDDLRDLGKTMSACSDKDETEVIDLAVDTCLSGEYYLRENIMVQESPTCADGSLPTLMFYQNRRCTGSPTKVIANLDDTTQRCLWSEKDLPVTPYYWSLIYRCDTQIDDPIEQHMVANPALTQQNVHGAPGSMRYHHGTMFPCHSDFANRTHTSEYEPGNCHWPLSSWPLESMEIISPAVCSNGTRAQLALYEDIGITSLSYMCNKGDMTLERSLIDIDDWMLNTCISMTHLKLLRGGLGKALGAMFYCDGLKIKGQNGEKEEKVVEEEPILRGPRTSHSECATSAGRWQWNDPVRPKTFFYPEANTCITLPKGHQLRIHQKPTCPDGSNGRLATWREAGCVGLPKTIRGVDRLNCENWNLQSETSYMIWCGPDLPAKEDLNDKRAVISTDECPRLNMKPGWTVVGRDDGPTIRRLDADKDCIGVWRDDQLKVYGKAKCPNGKDAKLAKYATSSCWGKPDQVVNVNKLMNKCTQVCGEGARRSCSMKFTCDGR